MLLPSQTKKDKNDKLQSFPQTTESLVFVFYPTVYLILSKSPNVSIEGQWFCIFSFETRQYITSNVINKYQY